MTTAAISDPHSQDLAARLLELLAQIEDAEAAPRSDPRAAQQQALCAEIEALLRARAEARPRRQPV